MKIAVLSDIHGNYIALEECLRHAKEQQVDAFIFLGDYLGEFPYPQKTMQMLYQLREERYCILIRGNKEDYWLNRRKDVNCDWKDGNRSVGAMKNNYEHLSNQDLDYFESLPISVPLKFDGMESILCCHGTPLQNARKLLPGSELLAEVMQECEQKYLLCGHTHIEGILYDGEKKCINVGAVGVAMFTGGHKAQYMILHADGADWKPEFVALDYDVETVVRQIHDSGLYEMAPYWCDITIHLMRTGEVSHGTVLKRVMELNAYQDPWYRIPEEYWAKALQEFGIAI